MPTGSCNCRHDSLNGGDDPAWIRRFVDAARWRFAKTYVESYPHECTLARWNEEDAFRRAIRCVERWRELLARATVQFRSVNAALTEPSSLLASATRSVRGRNPAAWRGV